MIKIDTYSIKGTRLGEISLPKEFAVKDNPRLLAQAIRVYQERAHTGLADTKTRAEVSLTKKKWYRQKGTGRARHGAQSAPIFVGGGVAHGPKPTRRVLSLPKKTVKQALFQALRLKLNKKEATAVSGVEKFSKTSEVENLLKKIGKAKRYTFVLSEKNLAAKKFLRNIPEVKSIFYKNLNGFDVFFGGRIVFDKEIFAKAKEAKK